MNVKTPIYLDYSATTPVDPRVAEKMCSYLTPDGEFGNPASRSHAFGWDAEAAVEEARGNVAALVNADPREIVWTSGATESDNLAIKGAAHFFSRLPKNLEVRTGFVNAGVEGTEFLVEVDDTRTTITVFEGKVLASNSAGEVGITDGQSAVAEQGKAPVMRTVASDGATWATVSKSCVLAGLRPIIFWRSNCLPRLSLNKRFSALSRVCSMDLSIVIFSFSKSSGLVR